MDPRKPSEWDLGAFPLRFPGFNCEKPLSNTFHPKETSYKTGYEFFKAESFHQYDYNNKYKNHLSYKSKDQTKSPDK